MTNNLHQKPGDGWSLDERNPEVIESWMSIWGWLYDYYFRVQTEGWHQIPTDEPVLIVGSHNGGLASPDMVMMIYDWFRHFGTQRLVYGLTHPHIWTINPRVAQEVVALGAIRANPKMAIAAFQKGASVLVYPGGAQDVFRPYSQRHKIELAGRKGFIKLALRQNVPIVPAISYGAHDTLMVLGDIYPLMKQLHEWGLPWLYNLDPEVFPIYLGLPWGIAFGPLPHIPLPIQVHTRICKPIRFDRHGRKAARDRYYVDQCYQVVQTTMQAELDRLISSINP
ncbi:lysophospholipid acyltransferase family protein [Roseofilum capinflatum]|uniref:Lysophospholipid acyltransferase family protein n=1 Tax=Roseofilum capinflatum BLCC-M114 TaxID=3022440 RepID=A0ABT7B4A1_9CYAN|nr:lysophospholipid acyltransferase family protein [Roseofilum capinflatum]MDJ1173632.1 lysophospholipid acyltransferase family protein [Roseofilum capinflatum BLCC-M114]